MLLRSSLFTFIFCCSFLVKSQELIHQDIFNGGVTTGAISKGMYESVYWDTLQLHIEPGSTIRTAYLFYYRVGDPVDKVLNVNGSSIVLDSTSFDLVSNTEHVFWGVGDISIYRVNLLNYLTEQEVLTGEFAIHNPLSEVPDVPAFTGNWGYFMPMIYIEYENASLPKMNTALYVNDKDVVGFENYNFLGMNTRLPNSPLALSLFLDRICSGDLDGTSVEVNSTPLGSLGNEDILTSNYVCAGAHGTYFYQENQITGLYDDTANQTVNGADALLDLSSIVGVDNEYQMRLEHINYYTIPVNYINSKLLFSHAFSTPCDTFSTMVSSDTVLCLGDSLELVAEGGVTYSWLNHSSLSDSVGSIVWAKPEKSQSYTVVIENTPGCARTENVSVQIYPSPKLKSIEIDTATCGEMDGGITIETSQNTAFTYSVGDGYQSSRYFNNLALGDYLVQAKDYFGCVQEQEVNIPYIIDVEAIFSANPQQGAKPLYVDFLNQSINATNYLWLEDGYYFSSQYNESSVFTESGEYNIELIAFNNDSICADTAQITISVYDSVVLQIPNVISVNNDGSNDFFSVEQTGAKTMSYQIFNRWGGLIKEGDIENPLPKEVLWDGKRTENGKKVTSGVYFYKIIATNRDGKEIIFQGFLEVRY